MKNDGGPAFPLYLSDYERICDGMSLRDWFAGMAIQGMLANRHSSFEGVWVDDYGRIQPDDAAQKATKAATKVAYMIADKMIEEGKSKEIDKELANEK